MRGGDARRRDEGRQSQPRRRRVTAAARPIVAALIAVTVYAALLTGCGGDPKTVSGRFEKTLGHAPAEKSAAARVATTGTMVVANDTRFPPFSYFDPETKELVGFDIDVADAIGERLGVSVEFVHPNWDGLAAGLASDRFDVAIASVPVLADTSKLMGLTDPYYYTQATVLTPKKAPVVGSAKDLAGMKVGAGAMTSYAVYLQSLGDVQVVPYASDLVAVPYLKTDAIEAVMTSDIAAHHLVVTKRPVAASTAPFFYEPMAFAAGKDDPDWLAILNDAIAGLRDDGTLSMLAKKWFDGLDASQKPPAEVPLFSDAVQAPD